MILVTGATGTVGPGPAAAAAGAWRRGPRARPRPAHGSAALRVEVRIALGDLTELGDRRVTRQALRGVDTVIHLAASIRDQAAPVEELNGLATARLLRAAEAGGRRAVRLLLGDRRD